MFLSRACRGRKALRVLYLVSLLICTYLESPLLATPTKTLYSVPGDRFGQKKKNLNSEIWPFEGTIKDWRACARTYYCIGYPYVWISDCLGFPTQASGSGWSLVEHTRVCSKRKSARKPHIPPPPTTTKAVSCRPPFVPHRMVSKLYSLQKNPDACGVVCEASPMAMPSRPLCSHRHRHMAGPRDRFPQTWQCCLRISWQAGSFFQCSRINRGSLSLPHKEQRHPPYVCV